ncbi:hypothetical protein E6H37_02170 [Candidatus Bathyarchaeota archaeon]|nr:MAG: hypothetical protein E6H37_02170 [Candidatus Bathyarchaeota archaeon]
MAYREHSGLPKQGNLHEEEDRREGCMRRGSSRNTKRGRGRGDHNDSLQGREDRARLSWEKVQKGERIISLTEQHGTNILRKYARLAGVPDWDRLHNHRQRAYFGTFWARKTGRDPWKVQSLMGHKDLRATAVYVEELSLEEKKQLLDES